MEGRRHRLAHPQALGTTLAHSSFENVKRNKFDQLGKETEISRSRDNDGLLHPNSHLFSTIFSSQKYSPTLPSTDPFMRFSETPDSAEISSDHCQCFLQAYDQYVRLQAS
jgi:hypothetical protein